MEEMKRRDQQALIDKNDYIDLPAFFRAILRNALRHWILVIPLILCMTAGMVLFSKVAVKKTYTAGATFLVGIQLSDTVSYSYTVSEDASFRQYILPMITAVFQGAAQSEYMDDLLREDLNLDRRDEINGEIRIDIPYGTNMIGIRVTSDEEEDAVAIRDAVFSHLPALVNSTLGFVELDVKEWYCEEDRLSREFLTYPAVWIIGGLFLGIGGYLGLIFLYCFIRRDVETEADMQRVTGLRCLGRIAVPKKRKQKEESARTDEEAFGEFRRRLLEEIRSKGIRTLLFTGGHTKKGQSCILSRLEADWSSQGKKVLVADLQAEEDPGNEETLRRRIEGALAKADLVLLDGSSFGGSSEALVQADLADAMVLVVKEGEIQVKEMEDMLQALQFVNAVPIGYVFSRV